jgi:hypothetical protein
MARAKRTADQLVSLIKERSIMAIGPWPLKMTMLIYPVNDRLGVMVSQGMTLDEENYRLAVLWIATQMELEFTLEWQSDAWQQ